MKVVVCGEGSHEIGKPHHWDERRREHVSLDGWMQRFVRKVLGGDVEISVLTRRNLTTLRGGCHGTPLPGGHGAKALAAKLRAIAGGYDAMIFMVDTDSNEESEWQRLMTEVDAGFQAAAQELMCMACIPMSASESWMMADPAAWHSFAGYAGTDLPHWPETIWGHRDDPQGGHPHRYFKRVCDAAGVSDSTDTRAEIAQATNLETARERCPISLDPFLLNLEVLAMSHAA